MFNKYKKFITFASLSLITIGALLPISTHSATIKMSPQTRDFISGCESVVNVNVDASGQQSNATDMEINFNPDEIDIRSIRPGDGYETVFERRVDEENRKIFISAFSINSNLSSERTVASIRFFNKPGVTSTSFSIRIDGVGENFTFDSNVADASTSKDLLTGVTNGTYNFVFGYCENQPPRYEFINPVDRQKNVPIDSDVEINITDNESGVNLRTVEFDINGDIYSPSENAELPANCEDSCRFNEYITYSGQPLRYNFKIQPRNTFFPEETSSIRVKATDNAGNSSNAQILFDPPFVCDPDTQVTVVEEVVEVIEVIEVIEIIEEVNLFSNSNFEGNSTINQLVNGIVPVDYGVSPLLYYSLLAMMMLGFVILDLLIFNRKRTIKGTIVDPLTNKPLAFKVVEAFDLITGEMVDRVETDKEGKYKLKLIPANYDIRINDENIKWSESIIVPEVTAIRKLEDNHREQTTKEKIFTQLHKIRVGLAELSPGVWLSGFILSLVNLLALYSVLNILITTLYIVVFVLAIVIPYIYRKYVKSRLQRSINKDAKSKQS